MKQCLQGSSDSSAVIVGRYQSLVCGLTFALTGNLSQSEELAQETFVLAWKNLRQLRDQSKFKAWLCQIARNVVQNWRRTLRQDVIEGAIPLGHTPDPATLQSEPSDQVIRDEEQAMINHAIESMPEKYRLPLILFYRENKSHREVAQLIDVSENATRQRIARARAMLKEQVAQMVETSLAQTKPGKVFTGAVLSSIAGVAMKGTSVGATTGLIGKAISTGFSGLAAKITAVAGGLVLVTGLTYTLVTQRPSISGEEPEPTAPAITVNDTGDAQQQPVKQALPHDPPDNQTPNPTITTSPVGASDVIEAPEESEKDTASRHDRKDTYQLTCVDTDGKPVPGALVYVLQLSYPAKPVIVDGHDIGPNYQEDGPLTSDANGLIEFPAYTSPDGQRVEFKVYAVLPFHRVGVWQHLVSFGEEQNKQAFNLVLHESKTVSGQVFVPAGYDIASVHVDVMSLGHPAVGRPYGHSFSHFFLEEWGIFPGMFDVPVDTAGRFEVPDLPTEGRFNVRARGPGLAEAQEHVLDAQQVDFIQFKLVPQGVIEGTVVFSDTQMPAVNRKVRCCTYSNSDIARSHVGRTDMDGNYRIEGLNSGMYEVTVSPYTYPSMHTTHALDSVEVKAGHVTGSVDFGLEIGTIVTGTITEKETKTPIEGVSVVAQTPTQSGSGGISIIGTRSDRDGLYALRVPLGETRLYIADVPDWVKYPKGQGIRSVSVVTSGEILGPADYQLESSLNRRQKTGAGTVTGRALDKDGIPISQVMIAESREYMHGELHHSIRAVRIGSTDDEGLFRVKIQAQGRHQVYVGGYEWSAHRSEWFGIKKNETKDLGDVYLIPFSQTMSAQILDQEGDPLPNVRLWVGADDYYHPTGLLIRSDINGMVTLKHLPDAEISIGLSRDGYEDQSWKGFPGAHIEIMMKKEEKLVESAALPSK